MTPVDGRLQRLLARGCRAAAAGQEGETALEALQDLVHGHHRDPGRGELHRERDPVEPFTDAGDGSYTGARQHEVRRAGMGAVQEQTGCLGDRQGRHPPQRLARNFERFPAGNDQVEVGAIAEEMKGEPRACSDQMLTVVEKQQELLVPAVLDHRLQRRAPGLFLQLQAGDNCARQEAFIDDRCQVNEPDTVGVPPDQLAGELLSESGFAATARTGQRQQPGSRLQVLELAQLFLAADEGRQLDRQVGEMPRQRPDGWELRRMMQVHQLEDLLRPLEVFEPMEPEIPHLGAGGQLVHDQLVRGLAQHDLTSVAGCEHAGAAVESLPEVVAAAQLGLAGVDGDAQAQRHPGRPGRRADLTLDFERAACSPGGLAEDGKDAVSLAPDLHERTGMPVDGVADDRIVLCHRFPHGTGLALPEACGTF